MLSTMRTSWLLYSLLSLMALSSALNIEEALHIDGIEAYLHHGMKRQASGTGNTSPSEDSTPSPTPTSPTSTPTSRPTSTPSDPTTDETSTPTSRPTTTRPTSTPTTTTSDRDTSTTTTPPVRTSTPFTSTSVTQFTITTKTISNGQEIDVTSVSSSTSTLTGLAAPTGPAETQNGGSSSGGLSESNKKIIGGVVGGVGGAILLGGIALVCWRIWGRKKRVTEDDADLMAGTGSALGDKPQNGTSPFQSNLEQYHNPGGRPNAAANF